MEPPWVACPHIPMFSIGWRMGGGEDYIRAFHAWFRGLDEDGRAAYRLAHPEPDSWSDWYRTMIEIGVH